MKTVYFLRPVGKSGPVKIGCSITPAKRLRSVEIWSPVLLEIAATAPGSHFQENDLHHRFAASRLHGEWFEITPELQAVIDEVIATGKLPSSVRGMPASPEAWRDLNSARKGNLPRRDNVARLCKYRLSKRLGDAEKRALGFDAADQRPADVVAAVASYQGFGVPYPSPEAAALIDAYIAELNKLPKADRSFNAWKQWTSARDSGRA